MNFFLPDDLTNMVKSHFVFAFRKDNVNVFIAPHAKGNALVFHVKSLSLPAYSKEQTIFGKAIRLVIFLNDNHSLLRQMKMYDLNKVMVTEAVDPELSNKSNSAILDIAFVEETFQQLDTLRQAGSDMAETGIRMLIGYSS